METNTNSMVYVSTAALVWLFGVLVFLPLAEHTDQDRLSIIVSLIIFLAFSVFLVRGLKGFSSLLDAASKRIVRELAQKGKLERTEIKEKRVRTVLEAASLLVVYLLYSPLLLSFHPSLNGIAIILTLLAILWTLAKR
jgi:hypothetical protein